MNNNIWAWIKLSQVESISFNKIVKLVNALGDPAGFVGRGHDDLFDLPYLGRKQKEAIVSPADPPDWRNICNLMEKCKIRFVSYFDADYPEYLKTIYDPPLFLFFRGHLSKPADKRSLAVVGTRKPDNYGLITTKKITDDLVNAGFTIVSGLAYGVDTIAHTSTLDNHGRTIAVMATGCEAIYPLRNQKLASHIIEEGALVSEYIPGTKPEKWYFSARNRIISGLSLGTFVVQGKKSSGALITAKYATDQNRDIFALPGDINRVQSEGPNYLLKLGAKVVTSAEDILEEYDLYLFPQEKKEIKLTNDERKILDYIKDNRPEVSYDNMVINTGLSIGELSAIILSLEMKNLVLVGAGNMVSGKE